MTSHRSAGVTWRSIPGWSGPCYLDPTMERFLKKTASDRQTFGTGTGLPVTSQQQATGHSVAWYQNAPSAQIRHIARMLSVAVRAAGRPGARGYGHIADSVVAATITQSRLRRSDGIWRCRQERTVKPSAQPTLVRTQHLPPPAKTARWLRKRSPGGRFLLVMACVRVCHYRSMWRSGCVHMVYSGWPEGVVHITARFVVRWP